MEVSGEFPNNSKYVRVKAVNYPTPNYFTPNGTPASEYTASIPVNGSGSAGGSFYNALGSVNPTIKLYNAIDGANTQGLVGSDYNQMIALLGNPEAFQFNVLFTPGLLNDVHPNQVSNIIANTIATPTHNGRFTRTIIVSRLGKSSFSKNLIE